MAPAVVSLKEMHTFFAGGGGGGVIKRLIDADTIILWIISISTSLMLFCPSLACVYNALLLLLPLQSSNTFIIILIIIIVGGGGIVIFICIISIIKHY